MEVWVVVGDWNGLLVLEWDMFVKQFGMASLLTSVMAFELILGSWCWFLLGFECLMESGSAFMRPCVSGLQIETER